MIGFLRSKSQVLVTGISQLPLGRSVQCSFMSSKKTIEVIWINKDGSETKTPVEVGIHMMEAAHRNGIELEGACEGACACSTCHVILERNVYKALPEASEKEEDMLDQAYGLTPTSRLGCQVILTEQHDGIKIKLPKATRNFYVVCVTLMILAR